MKPLNDWTQEELITALPALLRVVEAAETVSFGLDDAGHALPQRVLVDARQELKDAIAALKEGK